MKRNTLTFAILLVACTPMPHAQESQQRYSQFRSQMMNEYQDFRHSILSDYDQFLEGTWKEYKRFAGQKADPTPKPSTIPTAMDEPTGTPEGEEIRVDAPEMYSPAKPVIKPAPTLPSIPPPTLAEKQVTVNFYGLQLTLPDIKTVPSIPLTGNKEIAGFWRQLKENRMDQVAHSMLLYKQQNRWNDYMYYLLVKEYTSTTIPDNESARFVQMLFLMVYSGFDARMGTCDGIPVLLLPFSEQIYARTFIRERGMNYYLFSEHKVSNTSNISSYELPDDDNDLKPLSTFLPNDIRLPMDAKNFAWSDGRLSITGTVNRNLIKLLDELPQMNNITYAMPVLDTACRQQVLTELRKQLERKGQKEALEALLHFVQYAFPYATDQEQFNREKPFFFEELLYYPKCDCEDRAVFFSFLVRQLLRLDCHLLDYPGHIAVAVALESGGTGSHYMYNGKTFYITDPTYIGAGIGMCMPDYQGVKPELLILK